MYHKVYDTSIRVTNRNFFKKKSVLRADEEISELLMARGEMRDLCVLIRLFRPMSCLKIHSR